MKALGCLVPGIAILAATLGAWLQHFYTCITEETYLLLIAGAILPPLGILHGWAVWLGIV
jgi:hypothetical protein